MKRFILLVVALASLVRVAAQPNPMEPIPADKAVRVGKLANGMTYYLRHNEKPKDQASFYILHNVGAIQENDAQQGLAHFLEHMAFNGTENLPGKTMIEALERNGVKFGADVNAFTMHDITCYNLTNVPTLNPGVIDTALLVLHDWSQSISLLPAEIDNERGVIMEELRTRDGATFRSMTARNKALNKGSKYEERNVIGYLEGLKSFSHDEIRNFYKTWYRPEYQAIIVVGDIDADAIETKIKELMSDIPASPADAPQKEFYPVPANEEPIVSIFADPENPGSVLRLFIKRPAVPFQQNNLVIRQMVDILDTYVSLMESMRIGEISRRPDAPFLGGAMQIGDLVGMNPTQDLIMWAAQTRDGELLTGYKAIVTEMEKMRRYGFTQGEFDRAQAELLKQAETIYANRNDRTNEEYTNIYLMAYRKNMPMPDAETDYQLTTELLKMITLEDVNAWAQNIVTAENQVITIDVPQKEGLVVPTEAEILAVRAEAMAAEVEAYEDSVSDEPLIPAKTKLKGSRVKTTAVNEDMGTIEWTLKNGAKIIVKPTQFKADEVLVRIKSDGGTALVADDQVFAAELLPAIVSMSGISNFSATDLNKKLAGKNVGLGLSIDNYTNGMQGSCSPRDLETLLQLIYLSFTNPRFSQEDFDTTINTYKTYLQNLTSNPDYLMAIETTKAIYGDNPRRQEATMEAMDAISFEQLPAIYKTLYPGANSFVFTFVGNIDPETLKPLVEKYIGSIPASKSVLRFTDDNVRKASGVVEKDFRVAMLQPKVSEMFLFTCDAENSIRNRQLMLLLTLTLNNRYHESIREEKGGTYGVGVAPELDYRPVTQINLKMTFDTNEQMADELAPIIIDELRKIAEEGPKASDIESSREYLAKTFTNSLESNAQWAGLIESYYRFNQNSVRDFIDTLNSITYDEVRDMAKKLIESGNMVKVIMRPEAQPAE